MEKNLTQGSIPRALILFSLPMIAGDLLQQFYNVADTLIVGRVLGAGPLSAVGSSYALMVLLTSVILGLCMGSGVVFAQLYGAGRTDELKVGIFNAFCLIFLLTLLLLATSYLLLDDFLLLLRIPAQAQDATRQYLSIIFLGLPAVFVYNFFAGVLRSVGNTTAALLFLGVSTLTNIGLDLLFMLGFGWGVAGAAAATVAAQVLSAVCIAVYFWVCGRNLCPQRRHCRYDRGLLWAVLVNSSLTAVQQSIMNFGILMVQSLVNSFGLYASGAFAIVVKIDALAYLPAQDFGNAFATFIAQNYGAGKPQRIRSGLGCALCISSLFCVFSSALVNLLAHRLLLFFVQPDQTQIISIGVRYLRIEGSFYVGIGVLFLLYGLYRGLGRASMSIVLTVISLGSRVLLAYQLSALPALGLTGIWWAIPIGWLLADLTGLGCYQLRKTRLVGLDRQL